MGELRSRFQELDWEVAVSGDLQTSLELLGGDRIQAALVFPLTLGEDTLEWQKLGAHLSPRRDVPWVVVGWPEAQAHALAALPARGPCLADWLRAPVEAVEIEARLQSLLRLQDILTESRAREAALEDQLITDHKTGLFNDRHFRNRMAEEFERSRRHGQPLALLLVDVDDFKVVNDRHSYEVGDEVLRAVGAILKRNVRTIDLAARIGGDEFGILLPNTTLREGVAVAARIREAARTMELPEPEAKLDFSVSAGVSVFEGRGLEEPTDLFLEANEALKAAKRAGKDRISFHDPRLRRPTVAGREGIQT